MPRSPTPFATHAEWSSRIDPLIARYRSLVPSLGQDDAAMAMSAVARMILAVERAESVGSRTAVSMAEDSILQAGKLLEAVGDKGHQDET
jgi:hypothetical protein